MSSILLSTRGTRSILAAAAAELAVKLLALLPTASFVADGESVTSAEMQTQLTSYVKAVQTTNTARAQLHDLVVAEANALTVVRGSVRGLIAFVIAQYGEASSIFSGLGFTSAKHGKASAATKAEAVEKSKATREARGTVGKREKAKIHGSVPATAPTGEPAEHPAAAAADKQGTTKR